MPPSNLCGDKPRVDRAAALVSNLADYGLVWVVLALFKARRRGPNRRRAVTALGRGRRLVLRPQSGREVRRAA